MVVICGLQIPSWGHLFGITRLAEWCRTVIPSDGIFNSHGTTISDSSSGILFLWLIYFSWFRPELFYFYFFLSVAWPTGVQLLVFFCSSFPVELFDTQRISRCRSQHVVSVESWSLFRHSIYLWFVCFPWWSIDELENNNYMFWAIWQKLRAKLGSHKTGFSPPPPLPQYFNTDRSKAVHLLWFLIVTCSCCPYL